MRSYENSHDAAMRRLRRWMWGRRFSDLVKTAAINLLMAAAGAFALYVAAWIVGASDI